MLMGRMMIDHWILGVPYFFRIPRCRLFAHIWTVLLFVALSRSVPHLKFRSGIPSIASSHANVH